MHTVLKEMALGAVQGITEFLPVSSSGHLYLLQNVLGWSHSIDLRHVIVLHVGTLLATCMVFRKKLQGVLAFWRWRTLLFSGNKASQERLRYMHCLVVASLPTVFLGLFAGERMEGWMNSLWVLGGSYMVTTGFLLATAFLPFDRKHGYHDIPYRVAFWVGMGQALALLPGVSRSGITIAIACILGVKRSTAGEFSFMLSIPAIIGAMAYKLFFGSQEGLVLYTMDKALLTYDVIGLLTSFGCGYLALRVLLQVVHHNRLFYFGMYTFFLSVFSVLLAAKVF